jgi:hypothetical protein
MKRGQMRSRQLSLARKTWLVAALFQSLLSAAVRAQTSMTAFLPEVNSHFRLSSIYACSSMPKATWKTAT